MVIKTLAAKKLRETIRKSQFQQKHNFDTGRYEALNEKYGATKNPFLPDKDASYMRMLRNQIMKTIPKDWREKKSSGLRQMPNTVKQDAARMTQILSQAESHKPLLDIIR